MVTESLNDKCICPRCERTVYSDEIFRDRADLGFKDENPTDARFLTMCGDCWEAYEVKAEAWREKQHNRGYPDWRG